MNYWKIVRKVLRESNVVLEVIDARFAKGTRNKELEESCKKADKKLIIIVNKIDLISKEKAFEIEKEFSQTAYTVLTSTRLRKGKHKIMGILKMFAKNKDIFVTVIGYPNTGKSSVINYLKGSHSAKTSIHAGETKGKQFLRIAPNIMLVDTPGVIPFFKGGEGQLSLLAAKSPNNIKKPEEAAYKIIQELKNKGEKELFEVKLIGENEKILIEIAIAKKKLKQKGEPDTNAMARKIILDWQKGKIRTT